MYIYTSTTASLQGVFYQWYNPNIPKQEKNTAVAAQPPQPPSQSDKSATCQCFCLSDEFI